MSPIEREKAREHSYSQFLDMVPHPILEVDKNLIITRANREAQKKWLPLVEGESLFYNLSVWKEARTHDCIVEKTFEEKKPQTYQVETRNGEFFDIKTNYIGKQESPKVLVHIRDITEQKKASEALLQSLNRNKALFQAIPDLIFILSREGTYIEFKANHVEDLAIPPDKIVGRNIRDTGFSKDYIETISHHIELALETGEPQTFEYELKTQKGLGTFECRMVALNKDEVLAIVREITKRKRMENLARIQRDLAQALSTTISLDEALCLCAQKAIEVSGMDSGGVYLVDRENGSLYLVCAQGLSPGFVKSASCFDADSPNTRLVMEGKPFYNSYAEVLPETKDQIRKEEGLLFLAVVPVLHENQVIACLNIASHTRDGIPGTERNALEAIAAQMGGAIAHLQAEEALKKSEERYRTLQANVPVGIFRSTLRGKIISANPAMVKMFGFDSEEELLAVSAVDLYLDPQKRKELIKLLKDKGEAAGFEVQLKRKDGSTFWGSINLKGITDRQGNVIHQDGMLKDITTRKKFEQDILCAKQEWEHTFNSVPDLIAILEKNYTIRRVNKAMADRLGITQEEAIGLSCYRVFHGMDQPPGYCPHAKMLDDKKEHTELVHEKKLGGDFLITVSPLIETNGKILGGVHAARDLTERKKIEEELQRAEKLESLGLLAGGIAHDFNNILASAMVNITLARMNIKKEHKLLDKLNDAEKALARAKDLTRQLLTFSKGGAPIKSTSSIDGMLMDTVDFVLSGSKVKCEYDLPDNLWDVEIDEGQISQVIQNLIINAQQAMPEGGVVKISAENVNIDADEGLPLEEGRYIRITIKDQGIGIPREHLDKIFDPFFTTKQRGSGLGLSTAYSIVKNHKGLITVESDLGKGTMFYVYLPASEDKKEKKEVQIQKMSEGQGKILLMDDEDIILEATGELLQEMGYTVELAKDGAAAVRLYEEARRAGQPFDAVIMDLIVPGGMGGQEALSEILAKDPAARVVASSGYSTDPIMANYRKYGFVAALSKPYKLRELSIVLEKAMAGTHI